MCFPVWPHSQSLAKSRTLSTPLSASTELEWQLMPVSGTANGCFQDKFLSTYTETTKSNHNNSSHPFPIELHLTLQELFYITKKYDSNLP